MIPTFNQFPLDKNGIYKSLVGNISRTEDYDLKVRNDVDSLARERSQQSEYNPKLGISTNSRFHRKLLSSMTISVDFAGDCRLDGITLYSGWDAAFDRRISKIEDDCIITRRCTTDAYPYHAINSHQCLLVSLPYVIDLRLPSASTRGLGQIRHSRILGCEMILRQCLA